jgi:hypothetical protein
MYKLILTEDQIIFIMGVFLGAGIMDIIVLIMIYYIFKPKKEKRGET